MKEIKHILPVFLIAAALCSGCQKGLEDEIAVLKERVTILEEEISSLNRDFQSLSDIVSAVEENDLITGVEKQKDGSYRIFFSSGRKIDLSNGADGVTPIMGIQKEGELYYWTIQIGEKNPAQLLKDSRGLYVRASTIVPKVKVEETGGKDYWYYSFDEESWHLLEGSGQTAHGYDGSSVFSSVDCSSDGVVIITLADGVTVFRIPTQAKFDELNAICDTINNNMKIINDLVDGIDTAIFIKELTRIEESGKVVGYDIVFADGRRFPLRNGRDTSEVRPLSIGWDAGGKFHYWMMGDTPVLYKGNVVKADPENVVPEFGAVAEGGRFYFTVSIGGGDPELLLDSEGNPVLASPVRFFESIEEQNGSLKLTLTEKNVNGDNKVITLIRMEDCTPYLHLSDLKATKSDGRGSFTASVDSLGINSKSEFGYELEAVAIDGVKDVSVGDGGELKSVAGSPKKSITHNVSFSLNEDVSVGDTVKVAVFLSWGSRTIMKVGEVEVE